LKRIEATVAVEDKDSVGDFFKAQSLHYTLTAGTAEGKTFVVFAALLPDELVDKAIEELSNRMDLRLKENTISVYNVEAIVSPSLEKIRERVAKESHKKSPLERLVNDTDRYTRLSRDVFLMALLATLIALAGLFTDNIAILIGAMLLSPILGPINAFSVNLNLGRLRKLASSEFTIIVLLVSVTLISAAATFIVSQFFTLPTATIQISLRQHATLVDVGIALILGLAGGVAFFAAITEFLVGVAIAVALVPPAAVAGIGLAFLDSNLFIGALILTFVYLVGLELGSSIVLRINGLTPRRYYQKTDARTKSAYSIAGLVLLFLILGLIVVFRP
jgi:uncharacterized hydrophobic protein (TIGR00341 family)